MAPDIDFYAIAPRGGSKENAFEELCSQVAAKTLAPDVKFERYWGAGGDGGVECLATFPDGSEFGWQAKYVFEIENLIKQAEVSLQTALSVHPRLTKYYVCFPFDLTGPTNRRTKKGERAKSGSDKFDDWSTDAVAKAQADGRTIEIIPWPASEITAKVVEYDVSGGLKFYFFSEVYLSVDWFRRHLDVAIKSVGPRYTPNNNVGTSLNSWLSSLDAGKSWKEHLKLSTQGYRIVVEPLRRRVDKQDGVEQKFEWLASSQSIAHDSLRASDELSAKLDLLLENPTEPTAREVAAAFTQIKSLRSNLRRAATGPPVRKPGSADPPSNTELVIVLIGVEQAIETWLGSPEGFLAFTKVFVLTGTGGSGKTHGICDAALQRSRDESLTCILFGHQFRGEPDFWTRLIESLGLPTSLGKDGLLDALNAAATASGKHLLICIDALNETRPRDYWQNRLAGVGAEIETRPYLKLCLSCRSPFIRVCLPDPNLFRIVEHLGFQGREREACNAFFRFYGLEPPLVPVLHPELSNPLFLKLVCETLKSRGLSQLPMNWIGLSPAIEAFLSEKEKQFAKDQGISPGAATIARSLRSIAYALATVSDFGLSWSAAEDLLRKDLPSLDTQMLIGWLVHADLLIEDVLPQGVLSSEAVLVPAYERLGDYLVADDVLRKMGTNPVPTDFTSQGAAGFLCLDVPTARMNTSVLSALAVIMAEKFPGTELPNLAPSAELQDLFADIAIGAIRWRVPSTFSPATQAMLLEVMGTKIDRRAAAIVLSVATLPSSIDALWIDFQLRSVPPAKRDANCAPYLRQGYELGDPVKLLIDGALDRDLPLEQLTVETVERWAILLLWFTASPDRRVKDRATLSAVALLRHSPKVLPLILDRFLFVDDDEVRERTLLCLYGALMLSGDAAATKIIAETCLTQYTNNPTKFQNALIRDHIRCIAELARHRGVLDGRFDPLSILNPIATPWPLAIPTDDSVEQWREADDGQRMVVSSCLNDDFFNYSINCLDDWFAGMSKMSSAQWIIKQVIEGLGYAGSGSHLYDKATVEDYGGGRSKSHWAERIGKKMQWIALFQLASRMHDNLPREPRGSEPDPSIPPLILQDERKMDPTRFPLDRPERRDSESWWIADHVNLPATQSLTFEAWQQLRDDLPNLALILAPVLRDNQYWRPLALNATWSDWDTGTKYHEPSRDAWIHLRSYLIPANTFSHTREALVGRNFFGEWMPHGASWSHGFLGEYPWSSAYDPALDYWHGWDDKVDGSPLIFLPSWNEIVVEWEYDGSLKSGFHPYVPAREFFQSGMLRWDGRDGFVDSAGKPVFRDPFISEGGSSCLLVDRDELTARLQKLGYRLVWTLLGEKRVLNNETPGSTYSQIAELNLDGSVTVGERVFFDDHDQCQGLASEAH